MFNVKYIFKGICILVVISLVTWQIYEYNYSNEDIVQVNFKRFHSNGDRVYPALTLCFDGNPENRLVDQANENVLKDKFYQAGSNQTILKIEDYIRSIAIKDFMNHTIRYSNGGSEIDNGIKGRELSTNIILRRYQLGNCFAIGIPFVRNLEINSIMVEIKKNIFKRENVPTNEQLSTGKGKFSVGLTYQNTFFPLIRSNSKDVDVSNLPIKCSGFVVFVRSMEIVNRRNKPEYPCKNSGLEDSIKVLNDLSEKLMCKPQHWNFRSNLPHCTEDKLVAFRMNIDRGMYESHEEKIIKPCRYIQYLWSDYEFRSSCPNEIGIDGTFQISVVYNDLPFKEISFLPAHTLWGLITNMLTIVGVILGVSVCQIPDLLERAKTRCYRSFSKTDVDDGDDDHNDENQTTNFQQSLNNETMIKNHGEILFVERLI